MSERYLINDEGQHSLTDGIRELITGAKKYVKISSFLMQDASISKMLKELASSGKIAVFLLSNKKDQETEEYKEDYSESMSLLSKGKNKSIGFDNHGKFLKELYYSGVHVRLLDNLHAKFIIADGERGLVMSANLAHNSLNVNVETGIEICGIDIKELEYIFDVMYNHADIVRFQGASRKDITERVDNKLNPKAIERIEGGIRLTVSSSLPTNLDLCSVHSIYDTIIEIINEAKLYVFIATWHFKLNKKDSLCEFTKAISNAIRRGVRIYLYSNTDMICSSLKQSRSALKTLDNLGCISFGDHRNHSKCVLSESKGILFTANIDSENGMTNGFEVGCIMSPKQRAMAEEHLRNLKNTITHVK